MALVPKQQQVGRVFSEDEIDLIKTTICKGASDIELRLFMYQAERTGLDPLARQIYAVKRWDTSSQREVMGIQTSIDGFRLIAERSGKYAGQIGPQWCGKDGKWKDVWVTTKEHPVAARVGILRSDFKEPCWGVARFDAYASKKKDGALTIMWSKMGDVMIAKCAEALGLRKAFPQELSGLYSDDEMGQTSVQQELDAVPQKQIPKIEPKKVEAPHDPVTGEAGPHTISIPLKKDGEFDWIGYGSLFIAAVKEAKDSAEIDDWIAINKMALNELKKVKNAKDQPAIYNRLMGAIGKPVT
jgi:phage recombination protein Bet